jgi:mono/diheme cytochrome c family protein
MRRYLRVAMWLAFVTLLVAAGAMLYLQGRGISAREKPSWLEAQAAVFMRGWMTPSIYKGMQNPVANTQENFLAAREHYADHCASCHANDGSGNTEMGRNLYPKAPDMRLPRTQELSDGELFYIIENGVMLTGMPGWSTGTPEGETSSWQLVHFIRRLPSLTPEDLQEMERMNPVSRSQIEEEKKIEDFLKGAEPPPASSDPHAGHRPPK